MRRIRLQHAESNALMISGIALVLSIIAIALSLYMFTLQQSEFTAPSRQPQEGVARPLTAEDVREQIEIIQSNIQENQVAGDLAQQVQELRRTAAEYYTTASGALQDEWIGVDRSLDEAQSDLRRGSINAINVLQDALENLEQLLNR